MQEAIPLTPMCILHNTLQKRGIKSIPSLTDGKNEIGTTFYMMQIAAPIVPGGPLLSVAGPYCRSVKEAKQSAALAFVEKYFNYESNVQPVIAQTTSEPANNVPILPSENGDVQKVSSSEKNLDMPKVKKVDVLTTPISTTHTQPKFAVDVVTVRSQEYQMLEAICLKNDLGIPLVEDISTVGLEVTPIFTAQCKVSDLCIRGKGSSREVARLHATMRMIELISGRASIPEILKSSDLTAAEMQLFALESYHTEMNSLNKSKKRSLLASENSMNDKPNVDVNVPQKLPAFINNKPDTTQSRRELMSASTRVGRIDSNNNNSVSRVSQRRMAKDFLHKTLSAKHSNASLDSNTPDCSNREVESRLSSDKVRENLTCLQAVSQIDRTLKNVEKQLHAEMIKALVYYDLSHRQTVSILSHEYEIFIYEGSSAKIFEGNMECTVQSIRVACLTELLIKLLDKHGEMRARKGPY